MVDLVDFEHRIGVLMSTRYTVSARAVTTHARCVEDPEQNVGKKKGRELSPPALFELVPSFSAFATYGM